MLLPAVNSKGIFKFEKPYSDYIDSEQELTVIAIRSINEILTSDEDPLTFIYKAVGLTESDMNEDSVNDIPIVVFITTGSKYIYVPADMIVSIPKNNGVIYQDKVIGINLGSIPDKLELDSLITKLKDVVYSEVGIKTNPEILPASSRVLIDYIEDKKFMKLLDGRRKVEKPTDIKIKELEDELTKITNIKNRLEEFIKNQFFNKDNFETDVTVPELVAGEHRDIDPDNPVTVEELIYTSTNGLTDVDPVTVEELVDD